jgi:hypothetical protein
MRVVTSTFQQFQALLVAWGLFLSSGYFLLARDDWGVIEPGEFVES